MGRAFQENVCDLLCCQVIAVAHSSVNMVPSKVEVSLRKADQVSWGKLEDPNHKPEPEPVDDSLSQSEPLQRPDWEIDDDDISDSDGEWAYDTAPKKAEKDPGEKKEIQNLKRKEVEEDMKHALEEQRKAEEEERRRRLAEEEEGYEEMPDLE